MAHQNLREAKQMMREFSHEAHGYLHAGDLLTKLKKYQSAMDVYSRGLFNVPASNKGREV
jgi:hypothetical protein